MMKINRLVAGLVCAACVTAAQGKQDVKPGDEGVVMISAAPTVIEKFASLKLAYPKGKLNWTALYDQTLAKGDKDASKVKDVDALIPALLGMRITDGVVTVMGRDSEQLKDAAADIEVFAKKLEVSKRGLERAKKVKSFASDGQWGRVYMELGFLQNDVMRMLNAGKNKNRKVLVVASGWIQGAYVVSSILKEDYKKSKSTLLREPLLLKQLAKQLDALDEKRKKSPVVKKLKGTIDKLIPLVDVPPTGTISEANVKKVNQITKEYRGFRIEAVVSISSQYTWYTKNNNEQQMKKRLVTALAMMGMAATALAGDITRATDDAYKMGVKWTQLGYNTFPVVEGVDGTGAKKEFLLSVQKGLDYVFLIGRDKYIRDIDIYVYDETGGLIMKDRRSISRAGVKFRSSYDGNARVIVHVARANGLGAWAMIICSRGAANRQAPTPPTGPMVPPTMGKQ